MQLTILINVRTKKYHFCCFGFFSTLINVGTANIIFPTYHERISFLSYFSTGKSQKHLWLSILNRNLQNKENEK